MPSAKKQLKKVQEEVEDLQDEFTGSTEKNRRNLDKGVQAMLSGLLTLIGIAVAILLVPGLTVAGILTGNINLAILLLALYVGLVYVSGSSARTFSFPFAIITVGVVLALWSFVPDPIASVFNIEGWLGVQLPALDGLTFFVLAILVAGAYWAVTIRVTGSAKKPAKVFDRVLKKYAKVIDIYTAMAGVLALVAVYVVFAGLQNFAGVLGEIGSVLGVQPFIPSNVFAVGSGFLALGGELPIIGSLPFLGDLTAAEFGFVTLLVLGIAVMAYFSASGPTSRLFRQFR